MSQVQYSMPGREFTGNCTVEVLSEVGIAPNSNTGNCFLCVTPVEATGLVLTLAIVSMPGGFVDGGTVTISATVTNLTPNIVSGVFPSAVSAAILFAMPGGTVAVSSSVSGNADYTITAADVAAGFVDIVATFSATDDVTSAIVASNEFTLRVQ